MNKARKFDKNTRDVLLIIILVTAALFYRRPDAFTHSQLWAEDYPIYFLQNEDMGLKALFTPYGGYLHFVPRLLALLFGSLKVNYLYIPICYDYSAWLITVLIALNIWKTSAYLNIKNRVVYAVAFVFLPLGSDIFMNYTNINWITGLFLINFLVTRYTDYTEKPKILNLFLLLIISLSGPFSVLLLPIIALTLFLERKEITYRKLMPFLAIILGGVIQLINMVVIDPNFYRGVTAPPDKNHLLALITKNANLIFFLNIPALSNIPPLVKDTISIILVVGILFLVVYAYKKIGNKRKYVFALYAIITFVAYIKTYWPNESQILALENPRYYFNPFLCITWILILGFDNIISPIVNIFYLIYFAAQYKYITMRLPDKQWRKQILEYYSGSRTEIEINPEGWHFPTPARK